MSDHERYEALLMRATDGVITANEQRDLDEHLQGCADCRDELADFRRIKEGTDGLRDRILADGDIQSVRLGAAAKTLGGTGLALIFAGTIGLAGFGAAIFMMDADIPWVVKLGAAAVGTGGLAIFVSTLLARLRDDPYREIDQ